MKLKAAILVKKPIETVWECWTQASHIKEWYHAADTWYVPKAEVDFKIGGKFKIRMAALDKTGAFDFAGKYTDIVDHQQINFTIDDNRKVVVQFESVDGGVLIKEQFDPTSQQSPEAQEMGWQLILQSFKKYVESV